MVKLQAILAQSEGDPEINLVAEEDLARETSGVFRNFTRG